MKTKTERWDLVLTALPLVRMVAAKYISRYNSFDDLYQVGLIGAYKAARTYDANHPSGMSFPGHAKVRIKEHILIYLRQQNRKGISYKGPGPVYATTQCELIDDITEGNYINSDTLIDIVNTFKKLDAVDRDMLISHYFEGITMTDIGASYNITAERVRQRINRAKAIIYENLEAYHEL